MCPGPKDVQAAKKLGGRSEVEGERLVDLGTKEFTWSYTEEPHKSR